MSLQSLIATGTKVWLDSIDPDLVRSNRKLGASGATSNPIIISDLIKTGRFDERMSKLIDEGLDDEAIAWQLTDQLVRDAQGVFRPVWEETKGNKGHDNRMIKVPATEAGLAALEELAAAGVTINVTLIFSRRQYETARDNVWRGAQRRKNWLIGFKSVYSIFVSRVDVYTEKHVPQLSPAAQGLVGIVNVKQLWRMNQEFWSDKNLPLAQEIIFASTGSKKKTDPPDKYIAALAGSDIQTNPPATNDYIEKSGKTYTRTLDQLAPQSVLDEIDQKVDVAKMEKVLMDEGTV